MSDDGISVLFLLYFGLVLFALLEKIQETQEFQTKLPSQRKPDFSYADQIKISRNFFFL